MLIAIKNLFAKNKTKLKVVLIRHKYTRKFDIKKELTRESEADLIAQDFDRCYGLIDDFEYTGVPVYLKLCYFDQFKLDYDQHPRDRSYTLDDFYKSNTVKSFKKGLSKLGMAPNIDMRVIGVIVVVVAIAAGFIFLFGMK